MARHNRICRQQCSSDGAAGRHRRRAAGCAGAALPSHPNGGVWSVAVVPEKHPRRTGYHAGCIRSCVGSRPAVSPHRLSHGLVADGLPESVPDASAAHGAPRRSQRGRMGRHSPAGDRSDHRGANVLQHVLSRLGEEERRIVLLHAVTGLKHREIAALLELPLPTVLSKYHRAIRKMRADLEGDNAHDK